MSILARLAAFSLALVFTAGCGGGGGSTPSVPTGGSGGGIPQGPISTNGTLPAANWLEALNLFRSYANLPPVSEDASLTGDIVAHCRYMVLNDMIAHSQDSSLPGATPGGAQAAARSNLQISSVQNTPFEDPMIGWMTGPFHGIGMIDPSLQQSAFGSYGEDTGTFRYGAGLDVLTHLGSHSVTYPILWPANGKTIHVTQYGGFESPDPLTSCPGYTAPTGPPLYVQIGNGSVTPNVTASTFVQRGVGPQDHCTFDETNYVNPDGPTQNLGRAVLASRDCVVLMPRNPLVRGATYDVSITINGTIHAWSFTVDSNAASKPTRSQKRIGR